MKLIITFLLAINIATAQQKVTTDCNTIFVCIDSLTYQNLFANKFIKDTLFICRETTSTTTTDQYTGKYAIGKSATLEFFKPIMGDKISNHLNDFGVEFKTRSLGNLALLLKQAQKNNYQVDTSVTQLVDQDTVLPWYKTMMIKTPKTNNELSIIEYEKSYLNYLGFDSATIAKPMTYDYFNQQISGGKQYPRQFNRITAITIQIHQNQLPALAAFCTLNGLRPIANTFTNNSITIKYAVVSKSQVSKIRKIEIELLHKLLPRIVTVSKHLQFKIANNTCEVLF